MANKQQAKKMAAKGKPAAQIKAKTGVGSQTANKLITAKAPTPKASKAPTPKAPKAPTQQVAPTYKNSAGDVVQTQYPGPLSARDQLNIDNLTRRIGFAPTWVPGLMEPGQEGYNPKTGGGNYVWQEGNVDPEQLRAWYRREGQWVQTVLLKVRTVLTSLLTHYLVQSKHLHSKQLPLQLWERLRKKTRTKS
jgi:hypothetical protein